MVESHSLSGPFGEREREGTFEKREGGGKGE